MGRGSSHDLLLGRKSRASGEAAERDALAAFIRRRVKRGEEVEISQIAHLVREGGEEVFEDWMEQRLTQEGRLREGDSYYITPAIQAQENEWFRDQLRTSWRERVSLEQDVSVPIDRVMRCPVAGPVVFSAMRDDTEAIQQHLAQNAWQRLRERLQSDPWKEGTLQHERLLGAITDSLMQAKIPWDSVWLNDWSRRLRQDTLSLAGVDVSKENLQAWDHLIHSASAVAVRDHSPPSLSEAREVAYRTGLDRAVELWKRNASFQEFASDKDLPDEKLVQAVEEHMKTWSPTDSTARTLSVIRKVLEIE